jgi:hypothetical protein
MALEETAELGISDHAAEQIVGDRGDGIVAAEAFVKARLLRWVGLRWGAESRCEEA